jgi:hypothetical protein
MRRGASVQRAKLPKLECQWVGTEANGPAWVELAMPTATTLRYVAESRPTAGVFRCAAAYLARWCRETDAIGDDPREVLKSVPHWDDAETCDAGGGCKLLRQQRRRHGP